jgi:hypothetical protein
MPREVALLSDMPVIAAAGLRPVPAKRFSNAPSASANAIWVSTLDRPAADLRAAEPAAPDSMVWAASRFCSGSHRLV